jgi:ABC-2 type transport system ATP-binding protein
MEKAIEIQKVSQVFRSGFWLEPAEVLKEVSFSVPVGSVFGFLGANGAGKTTLIHLLMGLRKPSSGQIRVFGLEAVLREARSKIGYLPERPYFHEHLTGEGLLRYYAALSVMDLSELDDRIGQVLREVGMERARRTELRRYSKGMLQRIGIAQALLHQPALLVLDEPMSGLDPLGRKEMRDLIHQLAASGRTIFMTSHVIPDVEAICNQVGLIQAGRLLESGPLSHFKSRGDLQNTLESLFQRENHDEF